MSKFRRYGHRTQHEVEFSTAALNCCWWARDRPQLQEKLRQVFGPDTTINLQFTAYWELGAPDREAGFPFGEFTLCEVEIESATLWINNEERIISESDKDAWDFLKDLAMDIAEESGEDRDSYGDCHD